VVPVEEWEVLKRVVFSVFLLLAAAACGDGTGPGDAVPPELAARWVAEPACVPDCGFTLTSVANAADSLNATAFAGVTTEITVQRSGTFRLVFRPGPDTASTASVRAVGSMLIVTDAAGVVDTLDYVLRDPWLDLHFRRHFVVIDFNGDGVPDPARARGTFRRR
jgi:hypothetical protein